MVQYWMIRANVREMNPLSGLRNVTQARYSNGFIISHVVDAHKTVVRMVNMVSDMALLR